MKILVGRASVPAMGAARDGRPTILVADFSRQQPGQPQSYHPPALVNGENRN